MVPTSHPVNTWSVHQHMRARMGELSQTYDFAHFTWSSFVSWLEEQRGRPIDWVPMTLPSTVFGAWLTSQDQEYVFFQRDLPPIHRSHVQFHEAAHMLCGHSTMDIDLMELPGTMEEFRHLILACVRLRATKSDPEEHEAEILSSLIQKEILHYQRVESLTVPLVRAREQGGFYTLLELI